MAKKLLSPETEAKIDALLERAQAIISDGFAKETLARTKGGREVSPCADNACNFCTIGALRRADYELNGRDDFMRATGECRIATGRLAMVMGGIIAAANDRPATTKKMVYDAFTLTRVGAWQHL